ncbi:ABC transporter ATP-binding protein [Nocardia camponoti]|uniref:ABC transporter ATP-binding protein n=1 Tax=Nocardia camponoti TaxID=1616106 RepID=A0A917Q9I0_9NOCA|nr:ABC transporter ATP-binding protein [Nocardia camponoti]GGK36226.1 ABC transporter ATP-binding protein [Nocardia camponoti]
MSDVVTVTDLRVALDDDTSIVSGFELTLAAGEIVGLVGESGSGKTTAAMALLGYTRSGSRIVGGRVSVDGVDVLADATSVRGRRVAYVAQDPGSALDPRQRVGAVLAETVRTHFPDLASAGVAERVSTALTDVGLPADADFTRRFPHQLSGGQQQRLIIATAFVTRPAVVVLDEPTTALDVTTQARILDTLRTLCARYSTAAVYVSHDLAVVEQIADRVVVLYAGRIAESGSRDDIFDTPAHPYTRGLLAAIPDVASSRPVRAIPGRAPQLGHLTDGCAFAPRCAFATDACRASIPVEVALSQTHSVACVHQGALVDVGSDDVVDAPRTAVADALPVLRVHEVDARYGKSAVLHQVSLEVARGECVAVVGESGSGKTTLARGLVGLGARLSGTVELDGVAPAPTARGRSQTERAALGLVFQNSQRALNPRRRIGATLRDVAKHFGAGAQADEKVRATLTRVALADRVLDLFPRDLSGGERQRVAIARALLGDPQVLICDEITSALDVSVQAAVLDLLARLRADGVALLFITHDLGVVRAVADRVVVLRDGHVVEAGATNAVLDSPTHEYTRALVADSPSLATRLGVRS